MMCDPCFHKNLEIAAVAHCEECNESFCKPCKEFHGSLKLTRSHTLRDIRNVPGQQDRNYLNQLKSCACSDQQVKSIEYFCNDHGEFCCGKCHIRKHKKCDNVEEIDDLIGRGTGKKFDAPLGVLEEKIQELTKISAGNTQLAEESYTAVEKCLVEVKQEIDDAYNELKTKVLSQAKTRKETLIRKIRQQNQNIETLSIKLNEQKANAKTVNEYGNDVDKYIFSHVFEQSSLKDLNSSESRIRSSLVPNQFTTKENHSIEALMGKLKEAIKVIDKEIITGSDSHDSAVTVSSASVEKETSSNVGISSNSQVSSHRMKRGDRVVRGKDWPSHWTHDGGPGGKGTVVQVDHNYSRVGVKWDCGGRTRLYIMDINGVYQLQHAD